MDSDDNDKDWSTAEEEQFLFDQCFHSQLNTSANSSDAGTSNSNSNTNSHPQHSKTAEESSLLPQQPTPTHT